MKPLNSAQRFWLLFSTALLVSTLVVVVLQWPERDPAVVADLQNPACSSSSGAGAARMPGSAPEGTPCTALRAFLAHDRVVIRTVEEYDGYRLTKGMGTALKLLFIWAVVMALVYLLGWLSGRMVNTLLSKRNAGKPAGR